MLVRRRSLLGFIAVSPFIVKASSIMPVRAFIPAPPDLGYLQRTLLEALRMMSEDYAFDHVPLTPIR